MRNIRACFVAYFVALPTSSHGRDETETETYTVPCLKLVLEGGTAWTVLLKTLYRYLMEDLGLIEFVLLLTLTRALTGEKRCP